MKKKDAYITHKGYADLKKKWDYLTTVKRRELSKAIGHAREHGDISENAEYDAAKEAQAFNERKIAELEQALANVQIIDDTNIPKDKALLGATVKLKDMESGEESEIPASNVAGQITQRTPRP